MDKSFRTNFKKAFSSMIQNRLIEMKEGAHKDHKAVEKALSTRRFRKGRKMGHRRFCGRCSRFYQPPGNRQGTVPVDCCIK
jgi:hypothetical protein